MNIQHAIEGPHILLGLIAAYDVDVSATPVGFEEALASLLQTRRSPLSNEEEVFRKAVRDMLRYGRYKPTGRGKPASEYLLRAAQQGSFPRINAVVDINNYISLKYLLPISLWDLEKAAADAYVFRRGREGESFVFNTAGQRIDVADLVVGCRIVEGSGPEGEPIVNPVKDALVTKTDATTRHVAAAIYAPAEGYTSKQLSVVCSEFTDWLRACGQGVKTAWTVLSPAKTGVLP